MFFYKLHLLDEDSWPRKMEVQLRFQFSSLQRDDDFFDLSFWFKKDQLTARYILCKHSSTRKYSILYVSFLQHSFS